MNKLQAAMRDAAAKKWHERRTYYKIGSYFKGCRNCGEIELVETKSGRTVERYTSGHNVFRSYDPKHTKWTYACSDCGSKDLKCWAPDSSGLGEELLGQPPIMGTRDAKKAAKKWLLGLLKAEGNGPTPKPKENPEIERIKAEIAELKALIEKGLVK